MVSIHAPARGATQPDFNRMRFGLFQSTPLHEGRHVSIGSIQGARVFQSTPLHEGRPRSPEHHITFFTVSIHAPARGATWAFHPCSTPGISFNPRPCTRGDSLCSECGLLTKVSIHAPARGATVSIHAPARGATTEGMPHCALLCFNPRPCTRGELHGGTVAVELRFNPRPCTRGDPDSRCMPPG